MTRKLEHLDNGRIVDSSSPDRATVAFVLPSLAHGGSQRVLLNLMAGLDTSRFCVQFIVFESIGPLVQEVPDEVYLQILGTSRLRGSWLALWRKLEELRPDVVVSTLGHVNLLLLFMRPFLTFRTKVVIREPNTPSKSIPSLRFSKALVLGYQLLYRRADVVICQSELMRKELSADYGVPEDRMVFLPNPVDIESIRAGATPAKRWPGAGLRFVGVGRLTPQKGFDRLVRAMAALPDDAHLTLVGDGPEMARLKSLAAEVGVESKVLFAGYRSPPWHYMVGADAFVMASRWEGLPNAALEALACGTPVIADRGSGGLPELTDEIVSGSLIVVDDDESLRSAMKRTKTRPTNVLRPSTLPSRFDQNEVSRAFTSLLEAQLG